MPTTDELLATLDAERSKFTQSDKDKMQQLCDQLVTLGVYPPASGIGSTPLNMVECYGVDWHQYRGHLECPHCKADLRGEHGPPFKREIGHYDRAQDRTMYFVCPDCRQILPPKDC